MKAKCRKERHGKGRVLSVVLFVILAACSVGCASTSSLVNAPKPESDDQFAEYSYFAYRGHPYQLRIEIDRTDPLFPNDKHIANFHPRGIASVWRYNKASGNYDIRQSNDEPIMTAAYVTKSSDKNLYCSGGDGVKVGRLTGIQQRPLQLEMKVLAKPGVSMGDQIAMTVVVNAKIVSRDGAIIYSEAEAEHSWTVTRNDEVEHGMQIAQAKQL